MQKSQEGEERLESGLWGFQTTFALNKEVKLKINAHHTISILFWLLNVNVFLTTSRQSSQLLPVCTQEVSRESPLCVHTPRVGEAIAGAVDHGADGVV